jgi:hypothetical protein
MQVVSGAAGSPKIHFEALPATQVRSEGAVRAAAEESSNVKLGEVENAQLPVVLDVNEFVEEE